jgi:prolyl-tRNA editing enzyme YbaK/EbsC (Cys-tRNA(Pro) deacylase)
MTPTLGTLRSEPVQDRLDLVAGPVAAALEAVTFEVAVTEIDPSFSDTAAFCAAYDVPPAASANCVAVAGRRDGREVRGAAVILATTRADVNGVLRRRLDVRKLSFAPLDQAVADTGMEYGAITPVGLPPSWRLLVDSAVVAAGTVVIGSGIRRSKLLLDGRDLASLPGVEVVDGLAAPIPPGAA